MNPKCGCNQKGVRATVHRLGSQEFSRGRLFPPDGKIAGYFLADDAEHVPESLHARRMKVVVATVLSAEKMHDHVLHGWKFVKATTEQEPFFSFVEYR